MPNPKLPALTEAEIAALPDGVYEVAPSEVYIKRDGNWYDGPFGVVGIETVTARLVDPAPLVAQYELIRTQLEGHFSGMKAKADALRAELAEATAHGYELTDWHRGEHGCRYDHHGYCQAHGLQEAVKDRRCPLGLAMHYFLAKHKEQTND